MKLLERIRNLFRPEGEISDGYHTFDDLYEYRMLYNACFFTMLAGMPGNPYKVHKSYFHHDGKMPFGGGWFIVMATLPAGQISNHYPLKYWHLFDIPQQAIADKWDGHTSEQAKMRMWDLLTFANDLFPVVADKVVTSKTTSNE